MDPILILLLTLIVVGYLYLYINGRYYLREPFTENAKAMPEGLLKLGNGESTANAGKVKNEQGSFEVITGPPINTGALRKPCAKGPVFMDDGQRMEAPYVRKAILDVDDYEYNLIFQNEGDRELTKALQNKLQSQYPMDWSTQPPSSALFQAGENALKESFKDSPAQPSGENPYKDISAEAFTPPDTSIQEMEERKILQTYKPASTNELTSYNLEDARDLIRRIYDAKGLIPDVRVKEDNVYEIIGTRKKDEKVVYEDENPPAQQAPVAAAGEGTITVPPVAAEVAAGLDPFFSPSPSTHIGRWDYQKFTPGLERMFAPTYPTVEWY